MSGLAGCVIIDAEGRILLLHRATPELTQWELPGGKIEAGETPESAAVREVREELGVEVKILNELGNMSFEHNGATWQYAWFSAEILSGTPRPLEEKFDRAEYHQWSDLAARTDLSASMKNLLYQFPRGVPGVISG